MISTETLRHFSLLAELEPALLESLAPISQFVILEKGEWLFHEGDAANALYLIDQGTVDLKLKLDEKQAIYATLTILRDGEMLGWSAIVDPYVYTLGARASDSTRLVKFDGARLRLLLAQHPDQGYRLLRSISQAMASRVNILSERTPSLTWRLMVSGALFTLSLVTGLLIVVLGVSILVAALGGSSNAVQALPVALLCLIVPIGVSIVARLIYPASERSIPAATNR